MADCTLPNAWNLPACAAGLPVMETTAATSVPRPGAPGTTPTASARPGGPGTVITSDGPNWLLLALGVGAGLYLLNRPKPGLAGPEHDPALNGPRRRKPRPAPKAAPKAAPQPAKRPAPRPRTHGQHVARLVIS